MSSDKRFGLEIDFYEQIYTVFSKRASTISPFIMTQKAKGSDAKI
jgi:hypothetical protein